MENLTFFSSGNFTSILCPQTLFPSLTSGRIKIENRVHLTLKAGLSSLWEITRVSFDPLFCSVKTFWILIKLFRVFIHSLNFTLFTHFLFIQQVFNELPWDIRSCSKSQEWSRGPDNKFLLLRN